MAKSIIQKDNERCYLCGRYACGDPLDKHHVFGGASRSKSEHYGLTVYLHHFCCHIFGESAVHKNSEVDHSLKEEVQKLAMEHYGWTVDDFRAVFGKNYIQEETE